MPRINLENREPEFRPVAPVDQYDDSSQATSLTLYEPYTDGASGDEFPAFEVTILTLPSSDPTDERFDILPDVVNDPLATTTVQVTGPMRLGLEDDGIVVWPLPDSDVVPSLGLRLPGREGIEIEQTKIEAAATILANALRDSIRAGLFE